MELASNNTSPLAYRLRPSVLDDFVGYSELAKEYPFLSSPELPSFIIWGPPGTGKTSLARLLAKERKKEFFSFSAVLGTVSELKKIMEEAKLMAQWGNSPIIFVDEIHRFNKAQQDALLPTVEAGHFILIGATTENPRYVVNRALLSRLHLVELKKLNKEQLLQILKKALVRAQLNTQIENIFPTSPESSISQEISLHKILELITVAADGDARRAINHLEMLIQNLSSLNLQSGSLPNEKNPQYTLDKIKSLILKNSRAYDRDQNRHYQVISAFIKSLRGSDPQAALLWLAVMLDGGEDPVFIARRLVIFASEDIGNADPWALVLATATLTAVKEIGLPEAQLNLAQAVTYLASTVKSNASCTAIFAAKEFVAENPTIEVPPHLINHSPAYRYPHNFPNHFVNQNYCSRELPLFYNPGEQGREKFLSERLKALWPKMRIEHEPQRYKSSEEDQKRETKEN